MNTQRNNYIVAFQFLKPDGNWSKWYPLDDYVNVQNGKVIGLMLLDLPSCNHHSIELESYYNNLERTQNAKTQFKFMPAQYNLKEQKVITIHDYDWSNHNVRTN